MDSPAVAQPRHYELCYFDRRGLAEPIRLLLAYTNTPYHDHALTRDEWAAMKPALPLGQLPVLIERAADGEFTVPQSMSILRHLARVRELDGHNERQRTAIESVAETAVELRAKFELVAGSPDLIKNDEATARYFDETLPAALTALARLLAASPHPDDGYFVTARPSYADLLVFDVLDTHVEARATALASFPTLRAFVERVRALPSLQAHLAQRRPADFAA